MRKYIWNTKGTGVLQTRNSIRQQLSQSRVHGGGVLRLQKPVTPLQHRSSCSCSKRKFVASKTHALNSPDAGTYERSESQRVPFWTRLLAVALGIWTSLQGIPRAIGSVLALRNELVLPSPSQVMWQTIRVLLYAGLLLAMVSTYDRGFHWLFTR